MSNFMTRKEAQRRDDLQAEIQRLWDHYPGDCKFPALLEALVEVAEAHIEKRHLAKVIAVKALDLSYENGWFDAQVDAYKFYEQRKVA